MDTERIIAGVGCFILALCLCCCGRECKEHEHNKPDLSTTIVDMASNDMSPECTPCRQSLPALNCVPSLCVAVGSQLCCVM